MQQSDHYEYKKIVREIRRGFSALSCKGSKKQQSATSTSTATRYNRLAQMAFFGSSITADEVFILAA